MSPARSNTLMCLEMAGKLKSNGSASSLTVASPSANRAKIARRVEFAKAAKVWLSLSSSLLLTMILPYLTKRLINRLVKYNTLFYLSSKMANFGKNSNYRSE
jgi:hypothetical protein